LVTDLVVTAFGELDHSIQQGATLKGSEPRNILKQEGSGTHELHRLKERQDQSVARVIECPLATGREALARTTSYDQIDSLATAQALSQGCLGHLRAHWLDAMIEGECFAGYLPGVNRSDGSVNRCIFSSRDGVEPLGNSTGAAEEIKYLDLSTMAETASGCFHPRSFKNRSEWRLAENYPTGHCLGIC
jgi:hypothetical protein